MSSSRGTEFKINCSEAVEGHMTRAAATVCMDGGGHAPRAAFEEEIKIAQKTE